ncbi:outer membrane beta-barrel protein [Montanilutibacter psychrotolerans]|uniref:Outer membrane protein beta-barrel domain-containing protein n=1 Tax=Montanilutibacter psychrotolerans TaxID=1327343 RepID=A0A3M8SSC2_9GAMM|nr:outer membrane beta-barrel protein [Lysobacter psychrotolerans]RNF83595.1 hypothetical protein EER27_09380 [Lysobacter psychrotolerans]
MKKLLVLALTLAAAPFAATAGEHSYTYVELDANRQVIESTGSDLDLDGFAVKGSFEFAESFSVFGGYQRGEESLRSNFGPSVDFTGEQAHIGLGYHHGVSDSTDLLVEVSYIKSQADIEGFEVIDGDDGRVSVGVQSALGEKVDAWVKANYTDGDVYDSEFSATAGLLVKFNKTWGLVGEIEAGDDVTNYGIGVRASF